PGDVAFEGFRIHVRAAFRRRAGLDSDLAQKIEIGMITGERENEVVPERQFTLRSMEYRGRWRDLLYCRIEVRHDLAILDPVFDVGLDPILHVLMDRRAAMHKRDPRAVPPQFERRNCGRVLGADHDHVRVKIRMRLSIVMMNLCKLLARNAHHVRQIVKARGNHYLARKILTLRRSPVASFDDEPAVAAGNMLYGLVLANVEAVMLGDL